MKRTPKQKEDLDNEIQSLCAKVTTIQTRMEAPDCYGVSTASIKTPAPVLFELVLPPTEFPVSAMPTGMLEAAKAIAEHVQAAFVMASFAVICAVAHIAQRLVNAERPTGGGMACSLFLLLIAFSGERKTECERLAHYPITEDEQKKRQQHKLQCEQILDDAHGKKKPEKDALLATLPQDPRTLYGGDTTMESIARNTVKGGSPAISLSSSEGGQFFGGHSMTADTRIAACGMLTGLFDGNGIDRNRVGADSGSGVRYDVRFGLCLAAQPVAVSKALSDPLLNGQGLLARFLFSAPDSLAGTRFTSRAKLASKASDDFHIKDYWKTLRAMIAAPLLLDEHGGLKLPIVPLDDEASDIWITFYNELEKQMADGAAFSGIRPFVSRGGELVRRLATVFAVWRHYHEGTESLIVDGTDMKRACLLVEYSLKEWNRQQGGVALTSVEQDAYSLLKFMQKEPARWQEIARSKIAQCGPGFLRDDVNRRNAAIQELLRRHWLIDKDEGICLMPAQ